MINKDTIAKMKDGVRIINLARADLVNADDLKAALESGKIASYVTDFPTPATVGLKNVVNIPHLGASTAESEDNCAVMAAQELVDFISTGNIKNSVNYPAVSIPHTGAARICLAHLNIANMLSQITSIVSGEGINIENLSNGSKGDYAYTIVEIGVAVPAHIIPKLEAIEGMIKVRVIN
jgi:D-3-phosphoglycerate dehydrogenase